MPPRLRALRVDRAEIIEKKKEGAVPRRAVRVCPVGTSRAEGGAGPSRAGSVRALPIRPKSTRGSRAS